MNSNKHKGLVIKIVSRIAKPYDPWYQDLIQDGLLLIEDLPDDMPTAVLGRHLYRTLKLKHISYKSPVYIGQRPDKWLKYNRLEQPQKACLDDTEATLGRCDDYDNLDRAAIIETLTERIKTLSEPERTYATNVIKNMCCGKSKIIWHKNRLGIAAIRKVASDLIEEIGKLI